MKWISTKNDEPKLNEPVLLFGMDGDWARGFRRAKHYVFGDDGTIVSQHYVTHFARIVPPFVVREES